jgi:calcium/calmodulin-dependent protein kinase I
MFTVSGEVKLIDFGLATNFPEKGQLLKGMVGSAFWIAPEMIRGLRHDHKADIWASGMCLFELVNGHIPHFDETKESQPNAPAGTKVWSA